MGMICGHHEYEYETTIVSCKQYDNDLELLCDPLPEMSDCFLFNLRKNDPNFVILYNKIILNKPCKIIYEIFHSMSGYEYVITDIKSCSQHQSIIEVTALLNIDIEFTSPKNYVEVVFIPYKKSMISMIYRLLIHKDHKEDMLIGQKYVVKYIKANGGKFYIISSFKVWDHKFNL